MAQGSIKDRAHELSSFVNAAYTTLSNHIERAEYLIKLSGNAKNGDDEIAKHEEEVIADDPDLVERIFELRMTIAETDGMEDVIEIKTALERDYKEELGKLTATFTSGQESFCRNFERR
jgi:DnaJ-domain-containing protein 1